MPSIAHRFSRALLTSCLVLCRPRVINTDMVTHCVVDTYTTLPLPHTFRFHPCITVPQACTSPFPIFGVASTSLLDSASAYGYIARTGGTLAGRAGQWNSAQAGGALNVRVGYQFNAGYIVFEVRIRTHARALGAFLALYAGAAPASGNKVST